MTGHEGKEATSLVRCCAINKSYYGKASMIVHEGKLDTSLVQCYDVENFHSGRANMTVQRQTASEQYVCLSQGRAKPSAQLVEM